MTQYTLADGPTLGSVEHICLDMLVYKTWKTSEHTVADGPPTPQPLVSHM